MQENCLRKGSPVEEEKLDFDSKEFVMKNGDSGRWTIWLYVL
jgi:hypothetical protein